MVAVCGREIALLFCFTVKKKAALLRNAEVKKIWDATARLAARLNPSSCIVSEKAL